ncbi:Serine/threonine-protein kinase tel1 [Teratosphaeriaceae sp. CCFEE 6253]|nr:Serine/threonine-protein kinase tel1 [Teratosphaeriaceae sp. CCFEE 6253]
MASQVTLEEAFKTIAEGKLARDREKGWDNLRHVLRYNKQNLGVASLDDISFHWLYEKLFQVVLTDKSSWLSAKSSTTRSSLETRLMNAASSLRLGVELGVRSISLKTTKAIVDHVMETLPLSSGGVFLPIALDYARCLRAVLSHQPHLEHLHRKEWDRALQFCVRTIKDVDDRAQDRDTKTGAERLSKLGTSASVGHRSFRSQVAESPVSQAMRTGNKQACDELILCISLLTAAPNAPIASAANDTLWTLIDYLKRHTVAGTGHGSVFSAINHILLWARTDNMALVKKATGQLIRLVQHFWPSKRSSLSDGMLVTLLYLQPYLVHLMETEQMATLRAELSVLSETLRSRYGKCSEKEQLQVDELRLAPRTSSSLDCASMATFTMQLRSAGDRAEHAWALVAVLATISTLLHGDEQECHSDDDEDGVGIRQRPRKRQRLVDDYDNVLDATTSGAITARVCSLQIVTFVAQQTPYTVRHLSRTIERLTISGNEDNTYVSSWALLALASCASQKTSADDALTLRWTSVWQLASRLMSNTLTCRAACHLLDIMLRLQLVPQANVAELSNELATALELSGPAVLADSSAHLLRTMLKVTQQNNPGKVSTLAEGVLAWACRRCTPGLFENKAHAATYHLSQPDDITQLVDSCLDHRSSPNTIAQATFACRDQQPLISYLLLLPNCETFVHPRLMDTTSVSASASANGRLACETFFLNQLIPDLQRTLEVWTRLWREQHKAISSDMLGYLCHTSCVLSSIAWSTFRDTRKQSQMQVQLGELIDAISKFAASTKCTVPLFDVVLQVLSGVSNSPGTTEETGAYCFSESEVVISCHIARAISARQSGRGYPDLDEEDDIDIDGSHDSQSSGRGKAKAGKNGTVSDSQVDCSIEALRANVGFHAFAVTTAEEARQPRSGQSISTSSAITDYILALSIDDLIASRKMLSTLPRLGLSLNAADAERLLEYCTEHVLSAYTYERSEVAQGTILTLISVVLPILTDIRNRNLFDLGVDMYDWYVRSLAAGVLSVKVQMSVFLDLCDVDVDYGRDSDVQSARTSLFKLVQAPSILVQYLLANRISRIFGLFVLSEHDKVFADLQANLPDDVDCIEGLSMRLLYLSRMASAWHSLLKPCVYYLFETAGRVKEAADYATNGIKELATALGFDSAQKLFRLFAPQLLHTWFEQNTLVSLPFAAFQYTSLDHLIVHNQGEIIAQLLMRDKVDSLHVVSKALAMSEKDMVRHSFARVEAYAISSDIRAADNSTPCEGRLRNLIGKDEVRSLAATHFAAIIGHYFLAMQQDDIQDQWLGQTPAYADAAASLAEMKGYSQSTRVLPPSQQPSFRSKSLPHQIERLCRRAPRGSGQLLDAASFALAARMLLDTIDQALGPLHNCLVLRKLRLLICVAGSVALTGFPLEMLVHSIRPFLSESQCADDVIGMMQYLLHHGSPWLEADSLVFTNGSICVMILQMQAYSASRQESTTQETQHQHTVQKMEAFRAWLVKYLRQCNNEAARGGSHYQALTKALASVRLPGNARKGTAESTLLMILLEQQSARKPVITRSHCEEALRHLAKNFGVPVSALENCMDQDETCLGYAQSLWEFIQSSNVEDGFLVWAGEVIGRSYAFAGVRPSVRCESTAELSMPDGKPYRGVARSEAKIALRLAELLLSPDRWQAGLADWTIRTVTYSFREPADGLAFEQMLPVSLVPVVADGTHGYTPHTVLEQDHGKIDQRQLRRSLEVASSMTDEAWTQNLAVVLCQWASKVPILSSLPALVRMSPMLATELLPCIAHIVLANELNGETIVRAELSNAMSKHLTDHSASPESRQRLLLRLMLYLRSQPWPEESTRVDRTRWLEMDPLLAAAASARCGMPSASLLFAESIAPVTPTSKRASIRVSLSQLEPVDIPDELLLSVFEQIDEPDSFYGVQQPATLDSVLGRLDYEGDGIKSLMFRSARMDSAMRLTHHSPPADASGLMRSLSALNLHSLEYALTSGPLANSTTSVDELLTTARRLQQWEIASPEISSGPAAVHFSAYQQLSRAISCLGAINDLQSLVLGHVQSEISIDTRAPPSTAWYAALASLTEALEVVRGSDEGALRSQWLVMQSRQKRMQSIHPEDTAELAMDRSVLFSLISQKTDLLRDMHVNIKSTRTFEVQALLGVAQLARSNGNLQEALSAATQVSSLAAEARSSTGLNFSAASMQETAAVLWDAGEAAASVKMMRAIIAAGGEEHQDLPIGQSGLLATLAHQLADARLEQPDKILEDCLRPAIKHLRNRDQGQEAGKVFYEFAAFCDRQLQHPGNLEDFRRIARLRDKKLADVQELDQMAKKSRKSSGDGKEARQARLWFDMDDAEYQRQKKIRDDFLQQSLQNYLLALRASDDHDICVLRFFAMWLESSDFSTANAIVGKHLGAVPSWKFVVLNNQLMSRLENNKSDFQALLKTLMQRICADHPYHSLHHLFSSTRKPEGSTDGAARSRFEAAMGIRGALQKNPQKVDLLNRFFHADRTYEEFACSSIEPLQGKSKVLVKQYKPAENLVGRVRSLYVPPATISIPLRPDGDYINVPEIHSFEPTMSVMGGLSHPKVLTAKATDGQLYKQLFKGTKDDDLRQDAIMEQVFEEVSKMLRNHKATRKRNLHVRTYKVLPLGTKSGIMEWVANSIPIGEWLRPAHQRYHPKSMRYSDAGNKIRAVETESTEERVKQFRKICEQMPPVMRHFFFERFDDPDEWFERRTAYTRTTSAISILGHVVGLGDRHCHNIMLDEKTGEAVHIDLGVAFEAGKVLPVPEKVPFRLSRDVVDAMGITKTEGVFRRCCEFTMDALREDKDSIMTLLNVLRYDPLYNWTVSPLRAKRMQDAQQQATMGQGGNGNAEEASSRMKEQGAGEADRALSIVEKKLSKTMSTAATVNELIQQAMDEKNLATLFAGWSAFF